MSRDTIVLYIVAAIALGFALINAIQMLLHRKKTVLTVGTISFITMPNAEAAKARNSKWAKIAYTADGKNYLSKNRIQVPMSAQVGASIAVRYDIDQPERIYSFSIQRIVVSILIAVICIIAAVLHLV